MYCCFFFLVLGCTPLILAATAGHASTVEILMEHRADIEAQSDRTKDTALSLACSGGRQEVGTLGLLNASYYLQFYYNIQNYIVQQIVLITSIKFSVDCLTVTINRSKLSNTLQVFIANNIMA